MRFPVASTMTSDDDDNVAINAVQVQSRGLKHSDKTRKRLRSVDAFSLSFIHTAAQAVISAAKNVCAKFDKQVGRGSGAGRAFTTTTTRKCDSRSPFSRRGNKYTLCQCKGRAPITLRDLVIPLCGRG